MDRPKRLMITKKVKRKPFKVIPKLSKPSDEVEECVRYVAESARAVCTVGVLCVGIRYLLYDLPLGLAAFGAFVSIPFIILTAFSSIHASTCFIKAFCVTDRRIKRYINTIFYFILVLLMFVGVLKGGEPDKPTALICHKQKDAVICLPLKAGQQPPK